MTKEKRIERELRDKVEELQAVLDAVPAAVFVAQDPECRTMYGNRMTERILRQPSGANLSKSAREDGPRNFRTLKDGVEIDPRDLPVQKAAISGEAVRDFELTLAFDGDDVVRIYGNAEPLFDSSGKPRGAVGAFVDITQLDYQKALQRLTASLLESRETASRELSRELHDVFSQDLAALSMEVSALRHSDEVADPLKERLSALGKKIGRLTEEIHRTARQLHPAILDDLGLEVALREECLTFSERYDIPVQFTCEDLPPSLGQEVSLCPYRVTQESLRNVLKHAGATEIRVRLKGLNEGIGLLIEDNGGGFDPTQVRNGRGLGLISMAERVRAVNGKFEIRLQSGTTVEVCVPLNGNAS
jgi:signal transduction histidine kinase